MKRLLLITAFLLALPLVSIGKSGYTAYAGHTIGGGYACQCGCAYCICDPGEIPEQCLNSIVTPPEKSKAPSAKGEELLPLGVIGLTILLLMIKRFTAA
jgi:hypothetical protein